MKLGIMADVFRNLSWEDACRSASELGLAAIEPVTGGHGAKNHCNALEMIKDRDALKKFKSTAQKYGLEISAFSCHSNPLHPDKKISKPYIDDIIATIDLAAMAGIRLVLLFAGTPGTGLGAKYPNWISSPYPDEFLAAYRWQWEEVIIPFWKDMAKRAKKAGVKFGFEMEAGDSVYSPETVIKLREGVGMEEICCNFDPSNIFYQGVDIEESIRYLGETIVHTHMKDAKTEQSIANRTGLLDPKSFADPLKRSWNYVTLGYGHSMHYWKKMLFSLRLTGFDGVLSIESENTCISVNEDLVKSVEFLKEAAFFEEVGKQWWERF